VHRLLRKFELRTRPTAWQTANLPRTGPSSHWIAANLVPICPDRPGSASDRPGSDSNRPGSASDRPGSDSNRPGSDPDPEDSDSDQEGEDFLESVEELFKGLMLASLLSNPRRRRSERSGTLMEMLLRAQAATTSAFGQPSMSPLDPDQTSDAGYRARSTRAAPPRYTGSESQSVASGAERPAEMHTCSACGRCDFGLLKCGRCMQVWYCNRKCQKAHWKHHKAACGSD
jgi:hypothetical protein